MGGGGERKQKTPVRKLGVVKSHVTGIKGKVFNLCNFRLGGGTEERRVVMELNDNAEAYKKKKKKGSILMVCGVPIVLGFGGGCTQTGGGKGWG